MNGEKIINQLGKPEGRLLMFGGVYSNLQSLTALKAWAEENEYAPEKIFCTGDILGYCAQPVECIDLIKEWGIHSIAGNVELQVKDNELDCGCDFTTGGRCDLFSKNWYTYIQSKIDTRSRKWLDTLPHHIQFNYGKDKFTIVHGSWFQTADYIFKSTPWMVKKNNLDAAGSTVIVAGHSGLPFIDQQDGCSWINPGVIGMPANDGSPKVWFATINLKHNKLNYQFHQLEYDHLTAKDLMIQNDLPLSYAETLATGIWDNCEILQEEETKMQGKKINLLPLII